MLVRHCMLLMVTLLFALASPAFAANGARVALVIGNGAYQNAVALPKPANDAADVATKLRGLGFTVIEGLDLTRDEMEDRLREFAEVVGGAELTLFFYAGHGMQVDGYGTSSQSGPTCAWELVKTSRDPAAANAFIQRFPTGERFDDALALLTEINAPGTAPVHTPKEADVPVTPEVTVEPHETAPALDPRALVVAVQEELRRAGCNPGGADGDWGNRSRGALGRFSRDAGLDISDMQPDGKLLDLLKSRPGVVCKAEEKPVVTERRHPILVAAAAPAKRKNQCGAAAATTGGFR